MNILIWNECYVAGGADWSIIDLVLHWPNSEDTFVLYINNSHEGLELLKEKMPSNVEVREFESIMDFTETVTLNRFFKHRLIKKLVLALSIPINYFVYKREISGNNFDALLMNNGGYPGGLTNFMVALAAQSLGIKKRMMIVRNYPPYHSSKNIIMRLSDWVSNKSLNKMVAVSNSLSDSIKSKTTIDTDLIDVIYNGVSVKNKISDDNDGIQVSFEKGLSVGIIGTLQERKGHQFLFKSWVQVIKEFEKARLYIVASKSSGDKNKLILLAKELGIAHSIVWIDFTRNVGDIYKQLDVVVMPSLEYESFGRIIVESMAFSVPIIATKVGGMPELINHGKDGFLVEKNDDDALASQIIDLLKNPEMRKSVGAEGFNTYSTKFTADIMSNNYCRLLHELK